MAKTIKIELTVPDWAGNDEHDIIHEARTIFHNAFTGLPDYVNDNVAVWDNRQSANDLFTETGITIDFRKCKDKGNISIKLIDAIINLLNSPEWKGIIDLTDDDFKDDDTKYLAKGKLCDAKYINMHIAVPTSCDLKELSETVQKVINDTGDKAMVKYDDDTDSIFTHVDMSHECSAHLDCDAITDIANQIINVYRPTE